VKLVHLVGFITKKFVTMHGHMNVEYNKRSHFLSTYCSLRSVPRSVCYQNAGNDSKRQAGQLNAFRVHLVAFTHRHFVFIF